MHYVHPILRIIDVWGELTHLMEHLQHYYKSIQIEMCIKINIIHYNFANQITLFTEILEKKFLCT